jgi:ubiquinone/menaquinone biosynthesis C-methylase UbiE
MFMNPAQIIAACNVQHTDTVADFGSGSGVIARALANIVSKGQVFAIEVNREMVAHLTKELKHHSISNVYPIWGDIETIHGSTLDDKSVDMVVLSNVLFQLEDKNECVKEAIRVLKPGGRILVIDWTESYGGMGPAPHHVFSKDRAHELFIKHGCTVVSENIPAGKHHYAILFKK